jgi:hypothetical protein
MTREIVAILDGRETGRVVQDNRGIIAGLLYLCLEHVDNLGAYGIPSGDRSSFIGRCAKTRRVELISSVSNN